MNSIIYISNNKHLALFYLLSITRSTIHKTNNREEEKETLTSEHLTKIQNTFTVRMGNRIEMSFIPIPKHINFVN